MPMLLALASPASSIRLASDSAKVMDDRGMVYSLSSRYCQALRTEHTSSAWQPKRSRLQREKCYRHILSPACLNLGSRHRGSGLSIIGGITWGVKQIGAMEGLFPRRLTERPHLGRAPNSRVLRNNTAHNRRVGVAAGFSR